jgi:predicted regulator of Ras-like GTPase activity (Roadblock/LC7/MglB family)
MPLICDQIVYTSFSGVGYKLLSSYEVPSVIEQHFLQNLVFEYWDSYNPPDSHYRAVYLHQLSTHQVLFGWLYNDGVDDIGRAHTPYFLSYYLADELEYEKLRFIFSCLELGPSALIDRQTPPPVLEKLTFSNDCSYQSVRPGVTISTSLKQKLFRQLAQKKLLRFFSPLVAEWAAIHDNQAIIISGNNFQASNVRFPEENEIQKILEQVSSQLTKFEAAAIIKMFKSQNPPLVISSGMSSESTLLTAQPLLSLLENSTDDLAGSEINQISAHTKLRSVVLTQISSDIYLLIKIEKIPKGLLESEIKRAVAQFKKLFIASQLDLDLGFKSDQ